jgi:hypothetical protein
MHAYCPPPLTTQTHTHLHEEDEGVIVVGLVGLAVNDLVQGCTKQNMVDQTGPDSGFARHMCVWVGG